MNSCKQESKRNSGVTKENTEEFLGPSINNENQVLVTDSFPFCQEHYMELCHFLNKCSLCKSSLESKSNRYCSEPDLLNWSWSFTWQGLTKSVMNVTLLIRN